MLFTSIYHIMFVCSEHGIKYTLNSLFHLDGCVRDNPIGRIVSGDFGISIHNDMFFGGFRGALNITPLSEKSCVHLDFIGQTAPFWTLKHRFTLETPSLQNQHTTPRLLANPNISQSFRSILGIISTWVICHIAKLMDRWAHPTWEKTRDNPP